MSRIGKMPIAVPAGVDVKIDGPVVTVKGPKGTLTKEFNHLMKITHVLVLSSFQKIMNWRVIGIRIRIAHHCQLFVNTKPIHL